MTEVPFNPTGLIICPKCGSELAVDTPGVHYTLIHEADGWHTFRAALAGPAEPESRIVTLPADPYDEGTAWEHDELEAGVAEHRVSAAERAVADEMVRIAIATCPECAAGKHGNCDGTAWDDAADRVTSCACEFASHLTDQEHRA
jgi:hypothetical protein